MAGTFQCPKCGVHQGKGTECLSCGIIFDRIRNPVDMPAQEPPTDIGLSSGPPMQEHKRHYFRMFRRAVLCLSVVAVCLVLYNSPPPDIEIPPRAVQQAENKVRSFQEAVQQGREGRLEMDQSELNGWIDTNLAFRDSAGSESSSFPAQPLEGDEVDVAPEMDVTDDAAIGKAKSSVRDIRIELFEDTLLIYAVFDSHGVDLSLELEGRLLVEDGYLRLDPIRGKLGSLPLPYGALQRATAKLFESAENREKFRLPSHIRDMKVDHGQLVVSSRPASIF